MSPNRSSSQTAKQGSVLSSKKKSRFRKAPGAPKRFKSAYIFFSTEMMQKLKDEHTSRGNKQRITDISKKISLAWKDLAPEEKIRWEVIAKKDKDRFLAEKKVYKGPWQLPVKDSNKNETTFSEASEPSLSYHASSSGESEVGTLHQCINPTLEGILRVTNSNDDTTSDITYEDKQISEVSSLSDCPPVRNRLDVSIKEITKCKISTVSENDRAAAHYLLSLHSQSFDEVKGVVTPTSTQSPSYEPRIVVLK